MSWLIRWAAMSVSRFLVGKDGKTPYQRQRGRPCELGVVPFGEMVLHRVPDVARDRHQALEERWAKGVWLGHARHSPEVLIGTPDGVVKAYAIRRLAEVDQWDGEFLKEIKGSPTNWKLDCSPEPQMVEIDDSEAPGGEAIEAPRVNPRVGEKRSVYSPEKISKYMGTLRVAQGVSTSRLGEEAQ